MDYKLLCLIFSLSIITSEKCGYIHLSIGATNNTIVMNWRFECQMNVRTFFLYHKNKELASRKIWSDREKVSHMETNVTWDYSKLPGGTYSNRTKPSRIGNLCFLYYMKSYKNNELDDKQCLMVMDHWMSTFKSFGDLRIGRMFLPGTRNSGATGRHQHYTFWKQLMFGIRYFDIPIVIKRKKNGKVSFQPLHGKILFEKMLKSLNKFFDITYYEIVILDIRGFYGFESRKDHDLLIGIITTYVGKWMAKRNMSNHRYGPKLSEFTKKRRPRLIVNYRYEPMIEKYDTLWNDILIQNGKKTNPEDLRKHMNETLTGALRKEKMTVYVAVLHPGKNSDERILADSVNPELSNWYHFDRRNKYINIIAVDFFEASRIHIDAVWINKYHH